MQNVKFFLLKLWENFAKSFLETAQGIKCINFSLKIKIFLCKHHSTSTFYNYSLNYNISPINNFKKCSFRIINRGIFFYIWCQFLIVPNLTIPSNTISGFYVSMLFFFFGGGGFCMKYLIMKTHLNCSKFRRSKDSSKPLSNCWLFVLFKDGFSGCKYQSINHQSGTQTRNQI